MKKENQEIVQKEEHKKESSQSIKEEHKITKLVTTIYTIVACFTFFILGSLLPNNYGWTIGWIVFIGIGLVPSICEAIKQKNIEIFAFPLIPTIIYLLIGFIGGANGLNLWSPWWIIFLTIPLYYAIIELVKYLKNRKTNEK